jgi:hypothetical protein
MPANNRFSDCHALRINRFGKGEKPLHCESNYHARNFENASIARKRRISKPTTLPGIFQAGRVASIWTSTLRSPLRSRATGISRNSDTVRSRSFHRPDCPVMGCTALRGVNVDTLKRVIVNHTFRERPGNLCGAVPVGVNDIVLFDITTDGSCLLSSVELWPPISARPLVCSAALMASSCGACVERSVPDWRTRRAPIYL